MSAHTPIPPPLPLQLDGVAFSYEDGSDVLKDVSCRIAPGEFVGIIGPNGAGKTTLLRIISGMLEPRQGQATMDGESVARMDARLRARQIALVPQNESVVFPWSVSAMVMLGRHPHRSGLGFEKPADIAAAEDAMHRMRITHLASRSVLDLSGGELHRVLIARALAQQTPILLLDEPNAHLDIRHQVDLFALLSRLHAEDGRTVIIITHDLNLAASYTDRILLVDEGRIAAAGTPEEVIREDVLTRHFGVDVTVSVDGDTARPAVRVLRKTSYILNTVLPEQFHSGALPDR